MTGLADAVLLAAVAIGCVRGSAALGAARWPRRSPGAAIMLWQALGLGGGLAAVGALLDIGVMSRQGTTVAGGVVQVVSAAAASGHLVPAGQPAPLAILRLASLVTGLALFAMLCWILVASSAAVIRARRRQRALLALLAHGDPKAPGALVVDHPTAAAYCLPGLRSQIVVSVGALDLLRPAELAAVLAHERAHLRERHDLVVLPFTALRRAFGWSTICAEAHQSVALLIEMLADDRALRARPARALAGALARFGTAGCGGNAPAGALAASGVGREGEMAARVTRILAPAPRLPVVTRAGICCSAALLVAVPIVLLVLLPT
jgi:Zn-dependent protease with chaperone function